MRLAPTNADLVGQHRQLLVDLAAHRLFLLWNTPLEEIRARSAEQLVQDGFCDEVRVFVKNDLHSLEKLAQGRVRLISSVSVVDQIVERVLNGAQNNREIEQWGSLRSKPGMGLHDEALHSLADQIGRLTRRGRVRRGRGRTFEKRGARSSDVSAFDWSVDQWALELDARIRATLTGCGADMHLKRARCLGLAVFVFSDGIVWQQLTPGIQKSGSYLTSSTNSRIRAMLARLVGRRQAIKYDKQNAEDGEVMAMGDDCIETAPWIAPGLSIEEEAEEIRECYASLGYTLKDWSDSLEFCSYSFRLDGPSAVFAPVRWHKMLATTLATRPRDLEHKQSLLVALKWNLRHTDLWDHAYHLLCASGWMEA